MQPQEIADIVAYLQSIAPEKMTDKEVYSDACQRCHSIKYADMKGKTMSAFTPNAEIKQYMGKLPPDLKMDVIFVDGHTEKQMLPVIQYQEKTIVFAADLIPTVGHIPQVYVMGYDTRPLLTMEEKGKFLKQCVDNEYLLFFEHDAHNELASLKMTEKGVKLDETFSFNDVFGY
jgi:hypothetical protein